MTRRKGTKNFYADVDISVRKQFAKQWKERDLSNNAATTAALKLWINLSREVQGIVLHFPDADVKAIADELSRRLRDNLRNDRPHDEQP